LPRGENGAEDSQPVGSPARPLPAPFRNSEDSELEQLDRLGRALVAIAVKGEPLDHVVPLARAMRPALLRMARRRMDEEALPLPELIVVGQALELTILECARTPSVRRFPQRFVDQLGVVFEYCRLTGTFVDRWVLGAARLTDRQQARRAAVVEHVVSLPIEERRQVAPYVSDGAPPASTAAAIGASERDVRSAIARALRAGRARAAEWLQLWRSGGERPASRPSARKRRS